MARKVAATLSDDLHEAGEILRRRRGYRSWSEYIASFVRHDAMIQAGEHRVTEPIAVMAPAERDEMDSKLLEMVRSEKGERGQWMRKCIYDCIKEIMHENGGHEPRIDDVEARLPSAVMHEIKKTKPGKTK